MAPKRYRVVSDTRLEFPDGQTVEPFQEFTRDYEPEMEFHHMIAGIVEVVEEQTADSEEEKEE